MILELTFSQTLQKSCEYADACNPKYFLDVWIYSGLRMMKTPQDQLLFHIRLFEFWTTFVVQCSSHWLPAAKINMAHADVTVLSTFACLVSYYFWYKIAPHLRLTPFLVYEAIDLSSIYIACMVYSAHRIQRPIV